MLQIWLLRFIIQYMTVFERNILETFAAFNLFPGLLLTYGNVLFNITNFILLLAIKIQTKNRFLRQD